MRSNIIPDDNAPSAPPPQDFCRVWNKGQEDEIIGRFFMHMDKDEVDAQGETTTGDDCLFFQEWVCMTYDFCTLKTDGLVVR